MQLNEGRRYPGCYYRWTSSIPCTGARHVKTFMRLGPHPAPGEVAPTPASEGHLGIHVCQDRRGHPGKCRCEDPCRAKASPPARRQPRTPRQLRSGTFELDQIRYNAPDD